MTLDYQKVWEVMNDLEMVTSKIVSAREMIDVAAEAAQNHDYNRAETMATAAHEFLGYYLEEFDKKFQDAWRETLTALKQEEADAYDAVIGERQYYEPSMPPWGHSDMEYLSCHKDDPSPECKGAWNDFWEESDYPKELKKDKVKRWVLPVEELGEMQFITFPDDLLEAADLKEGDSIEWVDNKDGSYVLKKIPQTYDEMIAAGYTMTGDGFWIKE